MPASAARADPDLQAPPRWISRREASPLERMPQLGVLLSASATSWTEAFVGLSATPTEMTFAGLTTCRIESLPERWSATSSFAVIQAIEWGAEIAFTFDRAFVATMVEALFGGDGDDAGLDAVETLSPVERQIAELMAQRMANAMKAGFGAALPTTFRPERRLSKPDFGFLGKANAGLMVARFTVETLGRKVSLDVIMPQTVLDPYAEQLGVVDAAEAPASDPRWASRLEAEVGRAMTMLQASIEIPALDLGTLARLAPGQILRLPVAAGSGVRLACGGDNLFRCELGQAAGRYTLRIEESLAPASAAAERLAATAPMGLR